MAIQGVDVSQWQGIINWQMMASKARFAFIRLSYGAYPDGRADLNWPDAKAAGIPCGGYHYYYRDVDPLDQAAAFVKACNGDWGELPPVIDVEDTAEPSTPWTQAQCDNLHDCIAMIETVTYRKPIVYTGAWFWTPRMGLATWASAYDLWIAQYGTQLPGIPAPWTTYAFWQFSSTAKGRDYGAASDAIDLDEFNGDEAAWNAYLGTSPK